ncbi:hypothetical protein AHF37_05993 [Paragonimus kellicotti]|nr:hypothetical protein AHF37_05993 [Paragonimus kellicotti]
MEHLNYTDQMKHAIQFKRSFLQLQQHRIKHIRRGFLGRFYTTRSLNLIGRNKTERNNETGPPSTPPQSVKQKVLALVPLSELSDDAIPNVEVVERQQ